MRLVATLALACLAGCATTPMELREANVRAEFQSSSAPFTAISCAARRIENYRPYVVSIREAQAKGAYEASVISGAILYAMVDATPSGQGSVLAVWSNPMTLEQYVKEFRDAISGC